MLWPGLNLAVTYTRRGHGTLEPRLNVNGSNDRVFPNQQDRIAFAVRDDVEGVGVGEPLWMELHKHRDAKDPNHSEEVAAFGRRVGFMNISGLFAGPNYSQNSQSHGEHLELRPEVQPHGDRHLIKTGFHWDLEAGNKLTAQNPEFDFQTLPDALADIPQAINRREVPLYASP